MCKQVYETLCLLYFSSSSPDKTSPQNPVSSTFVGVSITTAISLSTSIDWIDLVEIILSCKTPTSFLRLLTRKFRLLQFLRLDLLHSLKFVWLFVLTLAPALLFEPPTDQFSSKVVGWALSAWGSSALHLSCLGLTLKCGTSNLNSGRIRTCLQIGEFASLLQDAIDLRKFEQYGT